MPSITDITPLESGCFFHIYNRGINKEKIFISDHHYKLFINRYNYLLGPLVDTYAYCLLPNHFHFLLKLNESSMPGFEKTVSTHLNILFSRHAMMINEETNRYGSLFCKSFKRINIKNNFYLKNLIAYIHRNPVKHGLTKEYKSYRYGSYNEIVNKKSQIINTNEVISLFGSLNDFIDHHEDNSPYQILGKLKIEKFK